MELKFQHKKLKKLHLDDDSSGFQPLHYVKRLRHILGVLEAAPDMESIRSMTRVIGFHKLTGNRQGQYAITVKDNYRVTFKVDETKEVIYDVDYVDYH